MLCPDSPTWILQLHGDSCTSVTLNKAINKKEKKKEKIQMLTSFTFGMYPEVLFGEISSGATFRLQITNRQELKITLSIDQENFGLLVVSGYLGHLK